MLYIENTILYIILYMLYIVLYMLYIVLYMLYIVLYMLWPMYGIWGHIPYMGHSHGVATRT
jgi:hypothetical protein